MPPRRITVYWFLLIFPTITIGVLAFGLLLREQQRLDALAAVALQQQAQTIADNADLLVSDIKSEIMAVLIRGPAGNHQRVLNALKAENPLVDKVFMWTPQMGLTLPAPGTAGAAQCLPVLSTDRGWLWETAAKEEPQRKLPRQQPAANPSLSLTEEPADDGSQTNDPAELSSISSSYSNLKDARRKVRSWSQETLKNQISNADTAASIQAEGSLPASSIQRAYDDNRQQVLDFGSTALVEATDWQWVSSEGQSQWLGYARWSDGQVIGVMLDTAAIGENLKAALPDEPSQNHYFAICPPGQKLPISRQGQAVLGTLSGLLYLTIGNELPGWTVAFFGDSRSGASFLFLGGFFILFLIAAILIAGSMLLIQAKRDQRNVALKTSFVSDVSHELKTPLTTIRMYAEMLADGLIDNPEKRLNYLSTLVTESERLSRLVNNVLDFSRLEQNKKSYLKERVAINDLVASVVKMQEPRLQRAGMRVELKFAASDIQLVSDRDSIEQVLLNLIDNAIKYAASGGLLIITTRIHDNRLSLIVEDRGPGIAKKDRKRIFTTFHRLNPSLTHTAGCGLGLSISQRLVSDLGGTLRCEAADPQGARFMIELPL